MIDLNLLNESEPIELKLEENSKGGTSDYNELLNKPKINGVELKGELTTEDLNFESGVNDVTINGTSIVNEGVADIPIANISNKNLGLIRLDYATASRTPTALNCDSTGLLYVRTAGEDNISKRSGNDTILSVQNMDMALKYAMCDGKGAEWTTEEKASARERMGIDLTPMLDAPLVIEEDLVGAMNIELPTPCEQVIVLVKQPQSTTPITLYSGIFFETQQGTGAGNLLGTVTTVAGKYTSFDMRILYNGIVECISNINSTVNSGKSVINEYPNYVGEKIAKVGLSSISATLPKGTEIMVLGK